MMSPCDRCFEAKKPTAGKAMREGRAMTMEQAIRQTYADLYRQARRTRPDLGENMIFPPEQL